MVTTRVYGIIFSEHFDLNKLKKENNYEAYENLYTTPE
jgi:hypothetical protein